MSDFARPTSIDWQGHVGTVRFGEDSRLVVFFFMKSVKNEFKTRETGAPYHDNMTYIRIHEPGERLNVVERPATDGDKQRFPIQWNKYLQNKEQIPEGTPIELLFPNNVALADNLKAQGVFTVQQCAKLSANAIDNIGMGAQEYVNMANKYLENANSGVEFHKMQETIKKKDQEIKILSGQFENLKQQFNALLESIKDPAKASINPPWVKGHDAQAERINLNHPTKELVDIKKKKRPLDPNKDASVELG